MRSQSWMGSDFSYQDLTKDDDIIDQYTHRILKKETDDGVPAVLLESVPKENAPVVWGKEVLLVREDKIIRSHKFYDQDGKLVKEALALKIAPLGGKIYPVVLRMTKSEEKNTWTEIYHEEARFGENFSRSFFTLSNLRNPRQ